MERQFVVVAYVVHDKKVLLVHHKKLNMWLPVGGHIEPNEMPDETVVRELKEEAGIEVEFLDSQERIGERVIKLHMPNHIQLEDIEPGHQHIDLVYFCRAKTTNIKKSHESNDIKWFSLKELEKLDALENVKVYGKMAIEKIK